MLTVLEDKIISGIKDITSQAKITRNPNNLYSDLTNFFNKLRIVYTANQILRSTESPELCEELFKKLTSKQITITNARDTVEVAKLDRDILDRYTIRHYTSSDPSNWSEKKVKSNLTLTVENIFKEESILGRTTTSGHTNFKDWCEFGNVGDTFYCLFYDNEPVTRAEFLKHCTYYIEWSLDEFTDCWASTDWLNPTAEQLNPTSGSIINILLSYFSKDAKTYFKNYKLFFSKYINFEIKKHGSMEFDNYYAKEEGTDTWKHYKWNTNKWDEI